MPFGVPYNEDQRKERHYTRYGTRDFPLRRGLGIGVLGGVSEDYEMIPSLRYPLKRMRWFMNRIFKR